nr:glycosyltransferase [Methylobacterium sp. OTU13CASTA1]
MPWKAGWRWLRGGKPAPNSPDVTVVLTSCGRHDLLERTLASFRAWNTDQGIAEILVVEDGRGDPSAICRRHGARLLRLGRSRGQIAAIEAGYAEVRTPYIFHLEDDWEFYRGGFIERSRRLLAADPSTICVWLRDWDDTNGHPLHFVSPAGDFGVLAFGYRGKWHGFTFNPGLRRLSDYAAIGSFSRILVSPLKHEGQISQHYHALGFRAVILDRGGYVRHIGWDRRIPQGPVDPQPA